MVYEIPVCCKISLEGRQPPLHFKITQPMGKQSFKFLKVFASYEVLEPLPGNCEMEFPNPKGGLIRIVGERGPKPSVKVFKQPFLYITFLSDINATVEVRPSFIDPAKANSLAYVTKMQTKQADGTVSGIDEPKLPPQKTMLEQFRENKQNYTDLKAMIEETKKKDNKDFG